MKNEKRNSVAGFIGAAEAQITKVGQGNDILTKIMESENHGVIKLKATVRHDINVGDYKARIWNSSFVRFIRKKGLVNIVLDIIISVLLVWFMISIVDYTIVSLQSFDNVPIEDIPRYNVIYHFAHVATMAVDTVSKFISL